MSSLPPGVILILGGLVLTVLPRSVQATGALLLPVLGLVQLLFSIRRDGPVGIEIAGYSLLPVRVDGLSLVFGYIFHIAAFLAALFALHVRGHNPTRGCDDVCWERYRCRVCWGPNHLIFCTGKSQR
ncbi:MAG: hypothetical protein Ct9H300mP14_08460 [Gammaproteobacteria bacterium]|nr:MAG: hypothetical protein Ct9H300mP14_08460 [Gammaproteobacteria bacterium]